MAAPIDDERRARLLLLLERLGVALLVLAALVPRVRDLTAGFDRGTEGWQGAFFAIAAVNYERLGPGAANGYPVLNIDLDVGARDLRDEPGTWMVYTNHPPTVAWLAWSTLRLLGPDGWSEAWREGAAPEGIEPLMRFPFLLMHVLGLICLWWALREGLGARVAMLGLALAAVVPGLALFGTLVNYENPSLPLVFLAYGFYARYARTGARAHLAVVALCFALGSCITWAPVFFLPPLVVHAAATRRADRALPLALFGGAAALLPIVFHTVASQQALSGVGQAPTSPVTRATELLGPLISGARPVSEWLLLQAGRLERACTLPVLVVALCGIAVSIRRGLARGHPEGPARVDLSLPLLAGGALYLFAFYGHTLEPQHSFLMFVAPGVVALAAVTLDALAPRLYRLRAGIAPLVVVTSTLGLFCLQRVNDLRFELRAGQGTEHPSGKTLALRMPEALGAGIAEVLPPGAVGVPPASIGLNLAAWFYSWRSLWPAVGPDDPGPAEVATRLGLGAAPRYLLLPIEVPPGTEESVASLRAGLVGERAPDAVGATWLAWRLTD